MKEKNKKYIFKYSEIYKDYYQILFPVDWYNFNINFFKANYRRRNILFFTLLLAKDIVKPHPYINLKDFFNLLKNITNMSESTFVYYKKELLENYNKFGIVLKIEDDTIIFKSTYNLMKYHIVGIINIPKNEIYFENVEDAYRKIMKYITNATMAKPLLSHRVEDKKYSNCEVKTYKTLKKLSGFSSNRTISKYLKQVNRIPLYDFKTINYNDIFNTPIEKKGHEFFRITFNKEHEGNSNILLKKIDNLIDVFKYIFKKEPKVFELIKKDIIEQNKETDPEFPLNFLDTLLKIGLKTLKENNEFKLYNEIKKSLISLKKLNKNIKSDEIFFDIFKGCIIYDYSDLKYSKKETTENFNQFVYDICTSYELDIFKNRLIHGYHRSFFKYLKIILDNSFLTRYFFKNYIKKINNEFFINYHYFKQADNSEFITFFNTEIHKELKKYNFSLIQDIEILEKYSINQIKEKIFKKEPINGNYYLINIKDIPLRIETNENPKKIIELIQNYIISIYKNNQELDDFFNKLFEKIYVDFKKYQKQAYKLFQWICSEILILKNRNLFNNEIKQIIKFNKAGSFVYSDIVKFKLAYKRGFHLCIKSALTFLREKYNCKYSLYNDGWSRAENLNRSAITGFRCLHPSDDDLEKLKNSNYALKRIIKWFEERVYNITRKEHRFPYDYIDDYMIHEYENNCHYSLNLCGYVYDQLKNLSKHTYGKITLANDVITRKNVKYYISGKLQKNFNYEI